MSVLRRLGRPTTLSRIDTMPRRVGPLHSVLARICVCLALLLVSHSLNSQTQGTPDAISPTFHSKVRQVVVDVVVTSSRGEPVSGLHKDDFKVSENGKPQQLVFFEEQKMVQHVQTPLPSMPANVFTNYPAELPPGSVNVLLLDWLNTQPQDQSYVRDQVSKYLRNVPAGSTLAIFSLGSRLQMLQGFTTDASVLHSAVTSAERGATPQVSWLLPTAVGDAADQEMIALMTMNQAAPAAIEAAKAELATTSASAVENRAAITIEAFQELTRFLSAIPARKNVIWFAGSFPVNILPATDVLANLPAAFRQTADLLSASKVSIYPVSAEGLSPDATYNSEYEQGPSVAEENNRRAANQMAMEEIAKDTGGRAFYNMNGLSDVVSRIVSDGKRYYTLAYTPANRKMDGSFRSIQVKLSDPNYRLAYRRGYYAEELKAVKPRDRVLPEDPLLRLMSFGLPDVAQILYKVRVLKAADPESRSAHNEAEAKASWARYGVDFAIPPDDLSFETTSDGIHRATVEVMLVAYDRIGRPLNLSVASSEMSLPGNVFAEAQRIGIQVHREIDAPNGGIYLRTGVYDLGSGKAGTLGIPLGEKIPPNEKAAGPVLKITGGSSQ
jgi:VWFA-related protein